MRVCLFAALVALFSASLLEAQLAGTWTGSYTSVTQCPGSQSRSSNGSLQLALTQSGGTFSGNMVIDFQDRICEGGGQRINSALPLSGTVSGNDFAASLFFPFSDGPVLVNLTGSIVGTTMMFGFSSTDTTVQATLTRTSMAPPDTALTGTYNGPFALSKVCSGLAPITLSGSVSASLVQAGSTLTGFLTLSGKEFAGGVNNCTVIDSPDDGRDHPLVTAQVSGNTISGLIINGDGDRFPFTATINGSVITGHGPDQGDGESFDFTLTRTSSTVAPVVLQFVASPETIRSGQTVTLIWLAANASSVSIDNGVGSKPASGSVTVSPVTTTTWTLTAAGSGGTATAKTTVTVADLVISSFPTGMVQLAGQASATDVFSVTNVGAGVVTVTLTPNNNFFTIDGPLTFPLASAATQRIVIRATQQPTGVFDGTIGVSAGTASAGVVPVRLLSTTAPSLPAAVSVNTREEVSAPADQNPSGSVLFTNNGAAVIQGIAVADVPWIIPQPGLITIPAGASTAVSFTMDRSKRPDAGSLSGAQSGMLSLRFLNTVSGKRGAELLETTGVSKAGITLVDVVKPVTNPGSPPPLGVGEIARLIPGMSAKASILSDLLLSNTGTSPIGDLRMFFTAPSGTPQFVSLPQIAPNVPLTFPSVPKTVFGTTGGTGTLQIRSGSMPNISLAAVRVSSSAGAWYSTALPALRSNLAAGPGRQLILSRLSKATGTHTDVYVQEVSGNPATVLLEFFGFDGRLVSSRPAESIAGFGTLELLDIAPAGDTALRITNTSTSGGRVSAYALVVDEASGDAFALTDTTLVPSAPSGTIIVPFPAGSSATETRSAFVTNGGSSPVTVAVASVSLAPVRRRSAKSTATNGDSETQALPAPMTFTVGPLATLTIEKPTPGYLAVTAPPGSISVNGRISTAGAGRTFGTHTPVRAAGSGGFGFRRFFTGVDDSAPATVAAAIAGTVRTNLVLIETGGQPTTVTVTLQYRFSSGTTTTATASASRDFALAANQMLVVNDLARTIIGSERDLFGDLRNMQVDVAFSSGSGRVDAWIESIDNATGDVILRGE